MSDLFNYFVKAASTYKPDAAMRRGSYAQASDRGQYRSSTIGHQGLSRRTAAQLRQTHNLPVPGQQQTGPDAATRRGRITQGDQRRPDAPSNPSPAPRPAARPTQPSTVEGAPQASLAAQPATASANQSSATAAGAPTASPGPAVAVNPNSNLGMLRNDMLGDVRRTATDDNHPAAQAFAILRQIRNDAELQQALQRGYQAQLNGRMAGTTDYLNDPHYNLFKYVQGNTTLDRAGWNQSQWGNNVLQGALANAWQVSPTAG